MRLNIPNQITLGRLVMAVVFLALLSWFSADQLATQRWVISVCFWLYLTAGVTDILDGYLARTWNQVTTLGRVLDPIVDKVMVCGAFLLFASGSFFDSGARVSISGVQPWMAVLILTRELLVSAFRAQSEASGQDFGASWIGKLKMFIQSAAVLLVLARIAWFDALASLAAASVWAAVIITGASIVSYLRRAWPTLVAASVETSRPSSNPPPPPPACKPQPIPPATTSHHPAQGLPT